MKNSSIELFESIFQSLGEGLFLFDQELGIRYANKAGEKMFGYKKGELIGEKLEVLIPEGARKKHVGHQNGFLKNPHARPMGQGMELKGRKKSGKEFYIEVSLNHFSAPEGNFIVALTTDVSDRKAIQEKLKDYARNLESMVDQKTKDIQEMVIDLQKEVDERKEAEQSLEQSQELYRIIARNFPRGTISVIDKDLKYVFIEGQELFRLGVTSESLLGTPFPDRLQESIRKSTIEAILPVFDGETKKVDLKIKDNEYLLNAVPLKGKGKKVDRIMIVEQNVTEQRRAEENIKNALAQEMELGEMKSRFVSMASHEFRTPLSTILSSVYLAEQYGEKGQIEKSNEHLNKIRGMVKNLTEILNDFLSIGRLEEGKVRVEAEEFELGEFFQELVDEMQGISKEGQRIIFNNSLNGKSWTLDKKILRNILQNLFSNAIKYSDPGKEIFFQVSTNGEELFLEVEDQGMGIPKEDVGHIFTRFFRASNASNIQGTGLGLNIVSRYVELLDGKVEFNSSEGKGTKFQLRIPKSKNEKDPID